VDQPSSLSLVLGVGAFFALIANPLVGRLSDRTTSRFGQRRPWLVGAVLGRLFGLALIAFVPSVHRARPPGARLATVLLAVGGGDNYTLFFTVAAAVTLAGALSVTRIRNTR
jgi:MFS family permease